MEGGPPIFRQDFTCPALLEDQLRFTRTGLSPALARLSSLFRLCRVDHWPGPRSLATTSGVSVDVLSSGYLDVSVPRVRLQRLWIQRWITLRWGFPIRISTDQSLLAAPHGFSQRATSFIASQCQGIHQMPLKTLDRHWRSRAGTSPTTKHPAPYASTSSETAHQPPRHTPTRGIHGGTAGTARQRSREDPGRRKDPPRLRHATSRSHALPSSHCPRTLRTRVNPGPRPTPGRLAAPTHGIGNLVMSSRNGSGGTATGTGGAYRDRTGDLMLAKHALSQLS